MRTFYFNTGVKPYNTNVSRQIEAGNKFINGEMHIPFHVSDSVPEGARLKCLTDRAKEIYSEKDFIIAEVLGGGMMSKYAVFYKPLKP